MVVGIRSSRRSSFYRARLERSKGISASSEQERAALESLNTFTMDGYGYFLEQTTRPQTIGYSLLDSPIGLAAWMLARMFVAGEVAYGLAVDERTGDLLIAVRVVIDQG